MATYSVTVSSGLVRVASGSGRTTIAEATLSCRISFDVEVRATSSFPRPHIRHLGCWNNQALDKTGSSRKVTQLSYSRFFPAIHHLYSFVMPYNNTMKRTNTSSIRHVSLTVLLLLSASAHAFVPSSNTLHRTRRTILDRPQTNDPFSTTTTTSTTTSLSATPVAQVGLGALAGCVTGGLFAGGLHAIAGK